MNLFHHRTRLTRFAAVVLSLAGGLTTLDHGLARPPATSTDNAKKHLIVVAEESNSSVGLYDSQTGRPLASIKVGLWPHEVAVSANGATAYVTNFGLKDYDEHIGIPGTSISVIDLTHGVEVKRLYTFKDAATYEAFRGPHGIKLSPDGNRLFVNTETTDQLLVYDLTDPKAVTPAHYWYLPKGTHNFLFSPDGKDLWIVSGSQGLTRMDPATGKLGRKFNPPNTVLRGLSYTADQRHLIASANDRVFLLDPDTFQIHKSIDGLNAKQILYSTPTPDGKFLLAPAVWEGLVLVIDLNQGKVVKRIEVGIDPIHVVVAPHQKSVYVTHGRSKFVSEIDLVSFTEVRRIATLGGPNGLATAPYPAAAPAEKSVTFGAVLPLSGADAVNGQDLKMGYQFWEEAVNEAGGLLIGGTTYRVRLVFRDSQSRQEDAEIEALTAQLIHEDGAQFLFGGYPSAANLASAKVADRYKVPFVTASGAAEKIYDQGYSHVFGIMSPARGFLNGTVDMIHKLEPQPKTIAFLSCGDPAALQDARTTAEHAQKLGMKLVVPVGYGFRVEKPGVIVFDHNEKDFYRYAAALKEAKVDVIAVTGHLQESVPFVEAAERLRLKPLAFVFSVGPGVPEFATRLGKNAEHMIGTAMWSHTQHSLGHDRWGTPLAYRTQFYDRFVGKYPSHLAAGASACGLVYEEAFRTARSVESAAVTTALRTVDIETFYSRIKFDKRGLNNDRPVVTIQLRQVGDQIDHIPLWPAEVAGTAKIVWPFPGWAGR